MLLRAVIAAPGDVASRYLAAILALTAACGGNEVDCGDCPRPQTRPPAAATPAFSPADSSIVRGLVEIVARSPDGSWARRGTGVVISADGIIVTADRLVRGARDDRMAPPSLTVRAGGVDLAARVHSVAPGRGSGLVTFLKVDRRAPFAPPVRSGDHPVRGDSLRVIGFRDGPGVGNGEPPVSILARVPEAAATQVGRAGTREDPDDASHDDPALLVVRVDALEEMLGAPLVDRAGRVIGIVNDRVLGSERRWIVTRVRPEWAEAIPWRVP